jgi:hypothetical protein
MVLPTQPQLKTLSDETKYFSDTLMANGFTQQGWYWVSGERRDEPSVGVVTQLERFDDDGRSAKERDRWSLDGIGAHIDSIKLLVLTILQGAPSGQYRAFLFFFRSKLAPAQQSTGPVTEQSLDTWLTAGKRTLPFDVFSKALVSWYDAYVFIYEFKKSAVDGTVTFVEHSDLSADKHLTGAGLAKLLGRN